MDHGRAAKSSCLYKNFWRPGTRNLPFLHSQHQILSIWDALMRLDTTSAQNEN
jgi:hypothetical protein